MSLRRRLAMAATAAALVAGLVPLAAAPAQAGHCEATIYVFSRLGTVLPDNPTGRGDIAAGAPTSNLYGCAAAPDLEFQTDFIYPGSNVMYSRFLAGGAGGYAFNGDLVGFRSGPTVQREQVFGSGTFYTESELIALTPVSLGCTTATMDGTGGVEYCTLDRFPR
ncbi:MAG TPA: hypothetical protein VNE62_00590 [Actinomycetota bacterium]|nr:hypothetical protein [Actinomycetota bacterium]